jgi:ABC-2 type transport system permease protein
VIDLVTLPPLIFALVYVGQLLDPTLLYTAYYILLVLNGVVIATAFYITVLAMAIITLEIDHSVMIFRDLVNLGRLPVDIYKQPLRGALTYVIPIGIMITLPAKAIMGLVSGTGVLFSFCLGVVVALMSLKFWNLALKRYTSASS